MRQSDDDGTIPCPQQPSLLFCLLSCCRYARTWIESRREEWNMAGWSDGKKLSRTIARYEHSRIQSVAHRRLHAGRIYLPAVRSARRTAARAPYRDVGECAGQA